MIDTLNNWLIVTSSVAGCISVVAISVNRVHSGIIRNLKDTVKEQDDRIVRQNAEIDVMRKNIFDQQEEIKVLQAKTDISVVLAAMRRHTDEQDKVNKQVIDALKKLTGALDRMNVRLNQEIKDHGTT